MYSHAQPFVEECPQSRIISDLNVNSIKSFSSKTKCILHGKYFRYDPSISTNVLIILSAINQAKLRLSSINIIDVDLFAYVVLFSS